MKTVVYQGYAFQVPASWPVYRLDERPETCVRYDVHAVYLGKPGPNMRCAAGLVGRTQTVSFIPGAASPGAASPGSASPRASRPGTPTKAGSADLQRSSPARATVKEDPVKHELSLALGAAALGATVLGTYGTDPAVVEQVLNTLHATSSAQPQSAPAPAAPKRQIANKPAANKPAAKKPAAQKPAAVSKSWRGVPAHFPVQIVQPPKPPGKAPKPPKPTPTPVHPVGGFDTCTAPSVATMRAWHSDYDAVGIYLGGANAACAYGNLSPSWVRTVTSSGWGLLPTYVGPQAPCWSGTGVKIAASSAAAAGRAAALDAVSEAQSLGLGAGSPIYYDMEAYSGGTSCVNAVLTFISAWDRQVAAAGYLTGVYSSQSSGITDLQSAADGRSIGFTAPDALWIALWDNKATLNDGNLAWPLAARSKQYAGNITATIKGITLNIDKDIVGGPMARLRPAGGFPGQATRLAGLATRLAGESGSREPP